MIERETLVTLIRVAGGLHFVQIPGMVATFRRLGLGAGLAELSPLLRQMVIVMAGGIVLCVLGTGACVTFDAEDVASTRLGLSLCIFGTVFWSYRSAIQLIVYARSFPKDTRLVHHFLSLLFPIKAAIYALIVCVLFLRR
jgi:hypothetical protein